MAEQRDPLAYPADPADADEISQRLDTLLEEARARDVRQRKRIRVVTVASCVAVFIGVAIGVGSIFLNTALSDVRTVVHRSDQLVSGQAQLQREQECRGVISGAYAALESRRDNAFEGAAVASFVGDLVLRDSKIAILRAVIPEIDGLPPRGDAYRDGVTVDGVAYKPCTPSTAR
jgi:hypothetical protein